MKKLIFVSFAVLTGLSSIAQSGKNVASAPSRSNPHLKVFNQAVNCGDLNTGIMALNYYLSEQGSSNPYADTLAMLYMQSGAYPQCYYWADKRLKDKPDDNGLLEMKGISLDKLQQPKEAIEVFEKLYGKTKSPYHAYKLMELQYSIKRLAECVATANSAEKLQFKPEFVMTYTVGDQTGRTYLQAGVYNIHGLALYDLDRKTEAKVYFQKAIDLDSNFALARQNLEAMNTMEKNPGKVSGNTPTPLNQPANKQN
jgi:tetratricopeptide (TPR) repeat protein